MRVISKLAEQLFVSYRQDDPKTCVSFNAQNRDLYFLHSVLLPLRPTLHLMKWIQGTLLRNKTAEA